jgi:hypothetical protein
LHCGFLGAENNFAHVSATLHVIVSTGYLIQFKYPVDNGFDAAVLQVRINMFDNFSAHDGLLLKALAAKSRSSKGDALYQ